MSRSRIILAPDTFKGTLSAPEVAAAMERGVRRALMEGAGRFVDRTVDSAADSQVVPLPIGDGGEGTLDILLRGAAARGDGSAATHHRRVTGPLGQPVEATWAVLPDGRAYIELAQTAGLTLTPQSARDPMRATTYGVGELILAAIGAGCRRLIVGVGGSATVDGGTGLAQALGFRFIDRAGRLIDQPMCGGRLLDITRIEPPRSPLPDITIEVACDVTNPLLGPHGAARVYGPQKGATAEQVEQLEWGLAHLASIAGGDPAAKHAGAAGGTAYGLATFLNATLRSGIDLVLDLLRFDEHAASARLVLTGEGRLDGQSRFGKAALGVAARAGRHGIPTIAIVGSLGPGWEECVDADPHRGRLVDVISLAERFSEREALTNTAALIERAAAEAMCGYVDRS